MSNDTCLVERSLHSEMVEALAKSGELIRAELTAQDAHNLHMIIGISGEAGELVDCVKKAIIYRKPIDMDNLIEELGDLEFYLEGLRQSFGITRSQTLSHNIAKLSKRYEGLKFTDEAAQLRADKQHEPTTA
jgi:NTP pyrophosphatase (non-canonical NTP hydrolase)